MAEQGIRQWGESPSTSGDLSLTNRISAEESTRASADTSLTARVSTEESTRASADTSLTTRVSAEESARASGDASLTARVSTEESVRASVDTSLLSGINAPGAFDLQAAGLLTIDSSGAAITIGGDANAQPINVGTGAAARTITIGNVTGATAVQANVGTGGFRIGRFALDQPITRIASLHPTSTWNIPTFSGPSGAGTTDHVMYLGWNVAAGGGQLDATEPAWFITFESDFSNDGVNRLMEYHVKYQNGATVRQPWAFAVNRGTHAVSMQFQGEFLVRDSTQARQRILINDAAAGDVELQLGTTAGATIPAVVRNNVDCLRQLNAAGNESSSILRYDSSNVIQIGLGSTVTGITANQNLVLASGKTLDTPAALNLGTATATSVTIGNAANNSPVTVNSGTGTIGIGTGAQARTVNLGTGAAAQTVVVGSTSGASSLALRTGSGALTVTAGGLVDVNASGAVTIDSTGGGINIGADADPNNIQIGTGAAARTIMIGNGTGATSVVIDAGTGNINIGTTATARTTNLATGANSQTVTVGSTSGTSSLSLRTGSGAMTLTAGGVFDVNATGTVSIDSSGSKIAIGEDANTGDIGIGTGAAQRAISIGNQTGATSVTLDAGTGAISIGTSAQARTTNIATGAAAQTVTVGSSSSTSALTLDSGTNPVLVRTAGVTRASVGASAIAFTQGAATGTPPTALSLTFGAHTSLNAGTNYYDVDINSTAASAQITTGGTSAEAFAVRIRPRTYTATAATQTIAKAATLALTGEPSAGTNVSFTESYTLDVGGRSAFVASRAGAASDYTNARFRTTLTSGTQTDTMSAVTAVTQADGSSIVSGNGELVGVAGGTQVNTTGTVVLAIGTVGLSVAVGSGARTITDQFAFNGETGYENDGGLPTSGTITNSTVFRAFPPLNTSGARTITTMRGVHVPNLGATGITSAYGIDVEVQSGAGTNNRGIRVAGPDSAQYAVEITSGRFRHDSAVAGTASSKLIHNVVIAQSGSDSGGYIGIASTVGPTGSASASGTGVSSIVGSAGTFETRSTGTVASSTGLYGSAWGAGAGIALGTVTDAAGVTGQVGYFTGDLPTSGAITNGAALLAASPLSVAAGRTITTARGVLVRNQGATGVTDAIGIDIEAQTGASGLNVGLRNAGSTTLTNSITQSGGNVSMTAQAGGTVTLGNTGGAAAMTLDAGTGTVNAWTSASARTVNVATGAASQTLNLGSQNTTSATNINAGSGGVIVVTNGSGILDCNIGGAVTINSVAGSIGIGNNADAFAINIGTGAAARTITVGNVTGATSLVLNAGTGNINVGTTAQARTTNIATGAAVQTVNIATGAAANVVTVGSTTGAAATTLQGGSGHTKVDATSGEVQLGFANATLVRIARSGVTARLEGDVIGVGATSWNGNVGWFGTAAQAKKTVTGERAGNPALASLLTQLSGYGLLTDSTTAGTTALGGAAIRKTADETVTNSTTLQDDDHLLAALDASGKYEFEFTLFTTNAGASEGIKLAVGGSGGLTATSLKAQVYIYDDALNTLAAFARVTAIDSAVGAGISSGDNFCVVKGTIDVNAAGNLVLRWAQNTSGASGTTVQSNSTLRVTKLNA